MKTTRLFLASSSELLDDRKEFEIFINRKNKEWYTKGIFLELIIWEDFLDAISPTRLQDEYNKAIGRCDLFVMLFFTKVGKYTEEEFDFAFQHFKTFNKPLIFTYFKDAEIRTGAANKKDLTSLWAFQEKLDNLGHFYSKYENIDSLKLDFTGQLEKILLEGIITSDDQEHTQNTISNPKTEIPRLLTEPPFIPEVFLGRETDLQAIKDKLFSGDNLLLLVNGNGGVGKTSLASKYYHIYKDEYSHVAWVLSQKSISNALLTLAGPVQLTFEPTMPSAERLKKLLTAMAALPKPCLLVIDNANEIDDLKQNYQNLRRCTNFHLLITSRVNHFEQAEYYHIDGLPYDMALELFKKYYPKHTEAENLLFEQIHTAIGGNTLVVELLAKYLKIVNAYKTNYTLSGLLADLRTKGLLGLPTTKKVATDYQANQGTMREEKPEAIVAAMYDLSELTNPEKDLLFLFAILPAEAIDYTMIELLTGNSPDLEDNLDNLVQKGWVEKNYTTNDFKCNPLVQEIAKKKNPKKPDDCDTLIDVLNEKLDYSDILKNLNYQDAAIYARYAEAVVKSFDNTNNNLTVLYEGLGNYYQNTSDIERATKFFSLESTSFLELFKANSQSELLKNNLAVSYGKLGSIHQSMGHMEEALKYFEKYYQFNNELYEANPRSEELKDGLAISYSKLGDIHQSMGHMDEALKYFDNVVRLFKELYEANPRSESLKNGLAISYSKLGDIHQSMGHRKEALQYFENYFQFNQDLYEANPRSESLKNSLAISYSKFGDIHQSMGHRKEALKYFENDLALTKELYEANPRSESLKNSLAISFGKLGEIHQSMGHRKEALKYFDDAVSLFKELYEANPRSESLKNGLAVSYCKLGGIYLSLNNDSEAKQNFNLYKELTFSLLKSNPLSTENQSNYAEVAAISAILELQIQSDNQIALNALNDSIISWQKLYKQTGSEYFAKKIALVEQYHKGSSNYKETIIKLTQE